MKRSCNSRVAEMGIRSIPILYFPIVFFIHLSIRALHSIATDSINPGQPLSANQTITSQGGMFVLGFFTPGNSSNYYIGIWQNKVSKPWVVWVANRGTPLPNTSSVLMISEDGNLVLTNPSKIPIWSTNATGLMSNSTVAVLLDTGNLVLRDGSNSSVTYWQSFDHPTDTWLPGGKIGLNKITGEQQRLISWRNIEDPSPGIYSYETNGTETFFLLWNEFKKYWNTGTWNGQFFSLLPESTALDYYRSAGNIINVSLVANDKENYFTFSVKDPSLYWRIVLDSSTGRVGLFVWSQSIQNWILSWSAPTDQCKVYAVCGPFGSCNGKSTTLCTCLRGFEPRSLKDWNLGDRSGGCARRTGLQCGNNGSDNELKDGFLMIPNVRFPDNSLSLTLGSVKECELVCLKNCSCVAYTFVGSCLIWIKDLLNIQEMLDGGEGEGDLYLRLAASDLPPVSKSKRRKIIVVIIGAIAGAIMVICTTLLLIKRTKRRLNQVAKEVHGPLVPFSYTDLQHATKNFSEKLGAGSFGCVFKGTLPDSTAIAVKKLECFGQGEKEFRMEVNTIGIIQHVNLVRLRGFCSEGSKRLLVYDFMPNGSLDSHLFQKKLEMLNWKTRFQIAVGIARGLAYLHEKCRDYIIHCDIKPENILLDADFCPKVADFGMAKLLGREFSKVLTTMRGTIGYLAPEWISGLPITPKADVYSYGMMLLEIISGRRNMNQSRNGSLVYFPVWAATKLHEGDVLCMVDARLEGNVDMEELHRACKAACWCIQDQEASRPSMGQVIQILDGVLDVNIPPVPSLLQHLVENEGTAGFYSADRSPPSGVDASN